MRRKGCDIFFSPYMTSDVPVLRITQQPGHLAGMCRSCVRNGWRSNVLVLGRAYWVNYDKAILACGVYESSNRLVWVKCMQNAIIYSDYLWSSSSVELAWQQPPAVLEDCWPVGCVSKRTGGHWVIRSLHNGAVTFLITKHSFLNGVFWQTIVHFFTVSLDNELLICEPHWSSGITVQL